MKRIFDILVSMTVLLLMSPVILVCMLLIWLQDYKNPLYIASRVGINGKLFKMYKLRSMVANADKTGVDSTANDDVRITAVGKFIRKCKLDEVSQLFNVLLGDMSLVGPRPNVESETKLYTNVEKRLLSVRPGITDFASIVFADEGDILDGMDDPDLSYNQLIRPWKSRLGLAYIENSNIFLDVKILFYTVLVIFSRKDALKKVSVQLNRLGIADDVVTVATRKVDLVPTPPPGADSIVMHR